MKSFLSLVFLFVILTSLSLYAQHDQKHRVIVLTDIEADPDDTQSLVRLLVYSNQIVDNVENNQVTIFPDQFFLNQNYPNPFNPSTTITFKIPNSEFTTLKVYDILGREVSTLVSKKLNQGSHTYTFDVTNLASGAYYYRLEAGNFVQTRKMIYLK